jgi:hypothetical protein
MSLPVPYEFRVWMAGGRQIGSDGRGGKEDMAQWSGVTQDG